MQLKKANETEPSVQQAVPDEAMTTTIQKLAKMTMLLSVQTTYSVAHGLSRGGVLGDPHSTPPADMAWVEGAMLVSSRPFRVSRGCRTPCQPAPSCVSFSGDTCALPPPCQTGSPHPLEEALSLLVSQRLCRSNGSQRCRSNRLRVCLKCTPYLTKAFSDYRLKEPEIDLC